MNFFNSFADIAEEVNESVVTITTTNTVQLDRDVQNFYRYWGREIPDEYESKSLGSGVIVDDENAYIVTNHHVFFDLAKPIPALALPPPEAIAALIPINSPFIFKRAPPLFPGFIAASV